MNDIFNKKEIEINDKINDLIKLFYELEQTHSEDINEWILNIHGLQKIIGLRVLRRTFPETYPTYLITKEK